MGGQPIRSPRIGVKSKPKPKIGRWFVVGIPALFFIYLSTRPVMRLRETPPADFMEIRPEWSPKRRLAEERLAQAYWESTVRVIGQEFSYGSRLPDDPPEEFKVDERALQGGPGESVHGTRLRYWQRLQKVWVLPQAWKKSYEWNTGWFRSAILSVQRSVGNFLDSILARFRR